MAYVTPGTVAAGDVATAAAWNVITNDIISLRALANVVQGTTTTATSIASTSFTDTTITATITPTQSDSRIMIMVSAQIALVNTSSYPVGANFKLLRGATALLTDSGGQGSLRLLASNPLQLQWYGRQYFVYLDSPATTSATTYKLQAALEATANCSLTMQNNSNLSSIVLHEIPA